MNDTTKNGVTTGPTRREDGSIRYPNHLRFSGQDESLIERLSEDAVYSDEYPSLADDDDSHPLSLIVDALVDALPERERTAVQLTVLKGHSLRTAAETMGIDHKMVLRYKRRALEHLREYLQYGHWAYDMVRDRLPASDEAVAALQGGELAKVLSSLVNRAVALAHEPADMGDTFDRTSTTWDDDEDGAWEVLDAYGLLPEWARP